MKTTASMKLQNANSNGIFGLERWNLTQVKILNMFN